MSRTVCWCKKHGDWVVDIFGDECPDCIADRETEARKQPHPGAATFTFREYSVRAWKTAVYAGEGVNPMHELYPFLGLCSEAGEVAGVAKRVLRDSTPRDVARAKIKDELGDCLWYINAIALEYNINLDELARANLEKLEGRMERGTIKGEGER